MLKVKVRSSRRPSPGTFVPVSTYRVQLSKSFTFSDLCDSVDYFADLGISHLYLSPILQAVPGSTHGYDVIDHSHISTDLGGIEELNKLSAKLKERQIGIILDIVPNHMALPTPAFLNHQLWDVLLKGAASCYSHWFDVNWESAEAKVILPILTDRLGDVIKNGEFSLEQMEIPKYIASLNPQMTSMTVLRYKDHVFPLAAGTENLPLEELLEKQNYRLAYHLVADDELNYRRFFDIGALIALRMEDEDVFKQTHKLVIKLINDGIVDGLRIDHIDGLADPKLYLDRLNEATGGAWVVCEKILAQGESLENDWKTVGTTGYDALNAVKSLLINSSGVSALRESVTEASGRATSFTKTQRIEAASYLNSIDLNNASALIAASKRQIIRTSLYAEVHHLADLADEIFRNDPALLDHSWRAIHNCLTEIFVAFNRYRAYVRPDRTFSREAREAIDAAVYQAKAQLESDRLETLSILHNLILAKDIGSLKWEEDKNRAKFVISFQQICSAIEAKGVEDTAFYRYATLASICEVGADIAKFSISEHEFHNFCQSMQNELPYSMTCLSTHDTKRSEDSRALLSVLSQFPLDFKNLLARLKQLSAKYNSAFVDPLTENLMWQNILGTWTPDSQNAGPIETERLTSYLRKAMREAKTFTTWQKQNLDYENAVINLAQKVLEDSQILSELEMWSANHIFAIQDLVLGQKTLQLMMPGVADTYQGTERLNIALVDPDNRRPVDFAGLKNCLKKVANPDFDPNLPSGSLNNPFVNYSHHPETLNERKMLVTFAALQLRKEFHDAFVGASAGYRPLAASTDCALAFARCEDDDAKVLTIVTRRSGTLGTAGGWGKHVVSLPEQPTGFNRWVDVLTGKTYKKGDAKLVEIFERFPVAMLKPVRGGKRKVALEIWAPDAENVKVLLPEKSSDDANESPQNQKFREVETTKNPLSGVFKTNSKLKEGQDYLLQIERRNNDGVLQISKVPDPCSKQQPHGVDGFSRVLSLDDFKWTDLSWTGINPRGKVFYEMHVGTFTMEGTFDAAIWKLSELAALGVEIIEVMPICTFDGSFGWGYDVANLYSVFEGYGGAKAFQRFVNEAHNQGIGVCVDVVYNHLGPIGNHLNEVGPFYTLKHTTPWGPSFNFDSENNEGVRTWIVENAVMFFEKFHVDALRLDATHEIHDDSEEHILATLSQTVSMLSKNSNHELSLIAESDSNDAKTTKSVENGGFGLHMQWADDFHHALWAYFSKEKSGYFVDFGTTENLLKALKQGFVYDGEFSQFRNKVHGTKLDNHFDLRRFVVCFSNHDQIGNRLFGDRPSATLGFEKLFALSALTLLSPFAPLIFQGEEWAASTNFAFFADYSSKEVGEACKKGRAEEFKSFGWDESQIPDPTSSDTFENCRLDWGERNSASHQEILSWNKSLLSIRQTHITSKDLPIYSDSVSSFSEKNGDGEIIFYSHSNLLIVVNNSNSNAVYQKDGIYIQEKLLSLNAEDRVVSSNEIEIHANSVAVFKIS